MGWSLVSPELSGPQERYFKVLMAFSERVWTVDCG
jgi:hypothetical protein